MSQVIIQIFFQYFIRLSARRRLRVVFEIFELLKLEDEKAIFAEHIGKLFFFILCHTLQDIVGLTKLKEGDSVTIQVHYLARSSHFLYIRPIRLHRSFDVVNQMIQSSFNSDEQTEFTFIWFRWTNWIYIHLVQMNKLNLCSFGLIHVGYINVAAMVPVSLGEF